MQLLGFAILATPALLVAHSVATNRIRRAAALTAALFFSLGALVLVSTLPNAGGSVEPQQLATVGLWLTMIVGSILLAPVWISRLLRASKVAIYGSAVLGAVAATLATPPVAIVLVCYARIECI